jgi:Carbon starvation protein, predicted membrane protein
MAQILHQLAPGAGLMAFWYHYAILFEALFILTTLDAGTRVARFMLQDTLGLAWPALRRSDSLPANLATTALAVLAWGYFLIQGVRDPLGGINTLWPLFGIANQMLAAIALIFVSVSLAKMKRDRYLWVALIPTVWLVVCTLTAGWQKLFSFNPAIGFLAAARHYANAAAAGQLLAPAQSLADMLRIADNQRVDALLCALFMVVVVLMIGFGLREIRRARRSATPTAVETPALLGVADGH